MKTIEFRSVLIILAAFFVVVLLLASPLFSVSKIEVTGNIRISDDEILKIMGISPHMNIIFWDSFGAKKKLKQNTYIQSTQVETNYLSKELHIKVVERILSGYVEYIEGSYIYIDENGRVLETKTYFTEKLPVVVGLEFSKFSIGEILEVRNKASFDMVVNLARLLNKYEMGSDVVKVDVTNITDLHMFVGRIDVELGEIEHADEKVRIVKEIIENHLPDKDMEGFLNVKDIDKPARFRPLQ